jgi:hypothetical protein
VAAVAEQQKADGEEEHDEVPGESYVHVGYTGIDPVTGLTAVRYIGTGVQLPPPDKVRRAQSWRGSSQNSGYVRSAAMPFFLHHSVNSVYAVPFLAMNTPVALWLVIFGSYVLFEPSFCSLAPTTHPATIFAPPPYSCVSMCSMT